MHITAGHLDEQTHVLTDPTSSAVCVACSLAERRLQLMCTTMHALTDAAPGDIAHALHVVLIALERYVGGATGAIIEHDHRHGTWRLAVQHRVADQLDRVACDAAQQLRGGSPSPTDGSWPIIIPCWHQGIEYGQVLVGGIGPTDIPVDDPILGEVGRLIGMVLHHMQQIDDRRAEQRKLQTVVDTMVEGVVLADRHGQIILANRAAVAMLAIGSLDVRSVTLEEMPRVYDVRDMQGAPLPVEQLPIARALRGERFFDERIQIGDHAGNLHVVACSGAPVVGDAGGIEGAVVVFRDVTPQTARERARDDFLAIAAHELRSPLAAIHGFARMLHDHRDAPADITTRGLMLLTQHTDQLLALVDRLLNLSRLDTAELVLCTDRIDCRELIQQVTAHHDVPQYPLLVHATAEACVVLGDALCLREVLVNLIDNARRHSGQRSVNLTLRTMDATSVAAWRDDALNLPGRHAAHPAYAPAQRYVVIDVADTGIGICAEQLCQLFRRHPRGARGLGIGLHLCREFVVRHGGTIFIESHEHRGSCFSVILPLAEGVPSQNIREEGS